MKVVKISQNRQVFVAHFAEVNKKREFGQEVGD